MLRKRFIQVSLLITLMAISHTGFAQDSDGFYVIPIPVPTDEVVEVEVCNGTPIGDALFTVKGEGRFNLGDVYSTSNNFVIEIVGRTSDDANFSVGDISFYASQNTLPAPQEGVKGPVFTLFLGRFFYASIL
jgi:hypothetical protein